MMPTDFERALRSADEDLARIGMPADVEARLRGRLLRTPRRRAHPWRWGIALAAAATASALVLFFVREPSSGDVDAPVRLGSLTLVGASSDLRSGVTEDGLVHILRGSCLLEDAPLGTSIAVTGPASFRREPSGLRVVRGHVAFSVERRPPGGPPARVLVSHGAIAVVGTRFFVRQEEDRGTVALVSGRIRFEAPDGRSFDLAPGGSLSWPLPAATPPAERVPRTPPASAAPAAPRASRLDRNAVEGLLEEVAHLRSRGQYERTARVLSRALRRPWPRATAERLHFELGTILGYHLGDRARACRAWREHARRYPSGRYGPEVARALSQHACGDEGDDG